MSKKDLLKKLEDPEFRREFLASEIEVGLPMQIRAMREKRGWKQTFVAEKTGTKQPRFSLMEKPGYGSFALNTLRKIAALFDVALIVSFVPWGEMIDFVESSSRKRLFIPSFSEDHKRLKSSFARSQSGAAATNVQQLEIRFATVPDASPVSPIQGTASAYRRVDQSSSSVQISNEFLAEAHLASIKLAEGGSYVNAGTV